MKIIDWMMITEETDWTLSANIVIQTPPIYVNAESEEKLMQRIDFIKSSFQDINESVVSLYQLRK